MIGFGVLLAVCVALVFLGAVALVVAVCVAGRCGWRYTDTAKKAMAGFLVFSLVFLARGGWTFGGFGGALAVSVVVLVVAVLAYAMALQVLRFYDKNKDATGV